MRSAYELIRSFSLLFGRAVKDTDLVPPELNEQQPQVDLP